MIPVPCPLASQVQILDPIQYITRNQRIQEVQVSLQINKNLFNFSYNPIFSSIKIATWTCQLGSMRISHIRTYTFYYSNRYFFSSTYSIIYDKDKHNQMKLIISYKYVMDSNTFLFDSDRPKICYIQVQQALFSSMYVQSVPQ